MACPPKRSCGGRPVVGRFAAWRWLSGLVLVCGTLVGQTAAAEGLDFSETGYRLGNGLHIPGLGLTFGGYATGTYESLKSAPDRFAIEDASLSAWWDGPLGFRVFSEFDYEKPFTSRSDASGGRERYLSLERIYVDYAVTENASVRLGKFLTPIGRWNQLHAAPLVWTTYRPLVTTRAFPTNVTGAMVSGAVFPTGRAVEYQIYATAGGEVRPNPSIDPFSEALGGRLVIPADSHTQVGISYVSFEQDGTGTERKSLVGMDLQWTRNRYQLSVEALYRFSSRGSVRDERGAFVQFVAPLSERIYAVARYEHYRAVDPNDTVNTGLVGLNMRLTPAIVLKGEWVQSTRNQVGAPTGFVSSISLLF